MTHLHNNDEDYSNNGDEEADEDASNGDEEALKRVACVIQKHNNSIDYNYTKSLLSITSDCSSGKGLSSAKVIQKNELPKCASCALGSSCKATSEGN